MSSTDIAKHWPMLSGGDEEYITDIHVEWAQATGNYYYLDLVVSIDWEHAPSSITSASAFYTNVTVQTVGSNVSYMELFGGARYAAGYNYTPAGPATDAVLRYHFHTNFKGYDGGSDLAFILDSGGLAITGSPGFSASSGWGGGPITFR